MEQKTIKIADLEVNRGQIDGLQRKCYTMELDEHYCDVIISRWEKLTGKKAVKINE